MSTRELTWTILVERADCATATVDEDDVQRWLIDTGRGDSFEDLGPYDLQQYLEERQIPFDVSEGDDREGEFQDLEAVS